MWNIVTVIILGPFTVLIYISHSEYTFVRIFCTERLLNETKM